MTVSSDTRKAGPFTGTGTTGPFPFTFKVFVASDVLVVQLDTTTQIQTTLTLTTDYTVSLNSNQNSSPGGSITLVSALPSTKKIIISSQVPYLQQTDLTNQGGFYPEVITDSLDKATIQIQQLLESSDRQLTYPITDPTSAIGELPSATDRANAYLAFDANGNPIASINIPSYIYQGALPSDPTTRNDGGTLITGDLYFNTSSNNMRVYSTNAWVDVGVATPVTINIQRFSGTGSQTVFTLTSYPAFQNACEVFISGVAQVAGVDYTVTGSPNLNTLTFTTAPVLGTNNIQVRTVSSYAGGTPNDGSVTTSKIASSAVVTASIADGAVTGAKILDGTITSTEFAAGAVDTSALADSSVTSAKIVDGAIATADIANAAITPAKLSSGAPSWDTAGDFYLSGPLWRIAPAPTVKSAAATLTAAELANAIINTTAAAAYSLTMPTGASLDVYFSGATGTNIGFDFSIINTSGFTITMVVNTGVTSLGTLTVATLVTANFRLRRTAANTYVLYRV